MGTFMEKIIESEGGRTRLIVAHENGQKAWFAVEIAPQRYTDYKRDLKAGRIQSIGSYGTIQDAGWGEPSEHILSQMQ